MSILPKQLRSKSAVEDANKKGDFDPVPKGKYIVELVKTSVSTARSGADRLNFQLKVIETPSGDDTHAGRVLFYASNIDETGAPWLIRAFQAFGMPLDVELDDLEDYWGNEVLATVTIEEWQNQEQNKVTSLKSLDEVPASEADEDDDFDPDAEEDD